VFRRQPAVLNSELIAEMWWWFVPQPQFTM
jgi:hypothetical protein